MLDWDFETELTTLVRDGDNLISQVRAMPGSAMLPQESKRYDEFCFGRTVIVSNCRARIAQRTLLCTKYSQKYSGTRTTCHDYILSPANIKL